MTNLDTAYIENVTANCSRIKELCQLLASQLDHPGHLSVLADIHHANQRIKQLSFNQREQLRAQAGQ